MSLMKTNVGKRLRLLKLAGVGSALALLLTGLAVAPANAYTGNDGCINRVFKQSQSWTGTISTSLRLDNLCGGTITKRVQAAGKSSSQGNTINTWSECVSLPTRTSKTWTATMSPGGGSQLTGEWRYC